MMTPSREKRVHQSVSRFPTSANGFIKPSSRARRRAASKAKACLKDIESARLARRWKQVSGDPRLEPFQKLRSPPFLPFCPWSVRARWARDFFRPARSVISVSIKLRLPHLCSLSTKGGIAKTPHRICQPRRDAAYPHSGDTAGRAGTHRPRTGRIIRVQ